MKKLENSDSTFYSVNLMTDVSKIIFKHRQMSPFIAYWEPSFHKIYVCINYYFVNIFFARRYWSIQMKYLSYPNALG